MFFVECRECHGNCDRGELKDGICPECAEKIERRKRKNEAIARLITGSLYQEEIPLESTR